MTAPDLAASAGLPLSPEGEPQFFAPWQARAFAMTVALHEAGVFAWPDWVRALAAAVPNFTASGESAEDHAEAYFRAWVAATEDLLSARSVAPPAMVTAVTETWQRAAEATPHGTPIRYEAGVPPD